MATLDPGSRLGHYEVIVSLGAGGMGEVYEAKDTRLDRSVAIKVLPEHLSNDAALQERFEREARVISNLNHPHICTLHDVGREDGIAYLVLELIEGETLADRLQRGPLPLDDSLRYGAEIADALAKAHRAGVVHRDLKPGNIMLTRDGAKLLDFGLASVVAENTSGQDSELSSLPTAHKALTDKGTILGTYQYMAPEQVEGMAVDARTDIFAFGVVLYEMVSGKKAFDGKSSAKLMASILEREVEPVSPPGLDHVIRRSVHKDPEARWQSAQDVAAELHWIRQGDNQPESSSVGSRPRRQGALLAWILAGATTVAALGFGARFYSTPAPRSDVVRFTLAESENVRFEQVLAIPVLHAFSPDGRHLAFGGLSSDGQGLWVRPLDYIQSRHLPSTGAAYLPFWSPDSRQLGYFDGTKLVKVGLDGSPPQTLGNVGFRGGTWSSRDLVLAGTATSGLLRLSSFGGESTPVTQLDVGESSHRWPFFLPDGNHFVFTVVGSGEHGGIWLGSLDDSHRERLLPDVSKAEYASGYLVFARDGALMAQPFDATRQNLSGEATPIANSVASGGLDGYRAFSTSAGGGLAYHPATLNQELGIYDRNGQRSSVDQPGRYRSPALSPDGRRIAVERYEEDALADIWVIDLDRGTNSRLTFDADTDQYPIWSPDGNEIVFSSNRSGGTFALFRKTASGAGSEQLLLKTEENLYPTDWSRDGRYILYASRPVDGSDRDLWALNLAGDEPEPVLLLNTEFHEYRASFSPDGKWITYNSTESGRDEVYVQSFPPTGAKWQISTNGGAMPRFSADGSEVTYITIDGRFDAVAISGGEDLQAGPPRLKFEIQGFTGTGLRYAASQDGETFIFPSVPDSKGDSEITVVLNWPTLLKAGR